MRFNQGICDSDWIVVFYTNLLTLISYTIIIRVETRRQTPFIFIKNK